MTYNYHYNITRNNFTALKTHSFVEWVLILTKSSLSIISFINCDFGVDLKRYHYTVGHLSFSPEIFKVFHLTFRSVTHFELYISCFIYLFIFGLLFVFLFVLIIT